MFPILLDFGTHDLPLLGETHLFLPTYGVLFAIGAICAWWWFLKRGRTLDVAEEELFNLAFYSLLGGIVGAKLALIAVDWRFYSANPGELLGVLRSAGVLMGGVLGGAAVFVVYSVRAGLPLHRLGDAVAAPLALGQAIGRLGCLSAGCCWGRTCDPNHPLAIVFTNPLARQQTGVPLNVALLPVQLIQMVNDLLLSLFLAWLWRRKIQPPGTVFWLYVTLYSVTRGTIELLRGDKQRGLYFGDLVSTSQLIALAGLLLGLTMLATTLLRPRRRA
jgi:phosphatidylglycerol:prolipoprotein diacylglycerol transferase